MRKSLLFLAVSTALAGCAASGSDVVAGAPQTSTPAGVSSGPVLPPSPAKPQIGSFGFDFAGMDRNVAPGDNFYAFTNGTWARATAIPADRSNYGMFTVLDDLSRQRTRAILEEARQDPSSKIGNAYVSFLDEAGVEARGLEPIRPWLARIKGLDSKAGYAALAAEADRSGIGGPVNEYIGQDDKQPDVYALNLVQSGLGLPDRDYYLSKDPKLAETRSAYLAHLTRMFALAGEPDGAARANAIMAFETGIAKAHWTRIESRDATKTYNKMSVAQLQAMAPGFDFASYFKGIGADIDSLIVAQPSAIKAVAALVRTTPLAVLKDQLLIRALDSYAGFLPAAFVKENFAFYGTILSGTPELEPRWKRGVSFVTGAMGDDVGKLYVARHFPPETKAAADTLVKNIIAAMGRRIDKLDWMAPETKAKAHEKLAAFTPKIGYPDRWRDYSALQMRADDLFGNAMRARIFQHEYQIGKLGKPIYRWEWGMTPMEINAYANFGLVEIVFPAAILQPPFFDRDADPAVNYGAIGTVIGHELSHHFDDQGAKYDKDGRLSDWWTPQDVKNFEALTGKLATQYDAYEPLPGMRLQGRLTLGENIADLAGLTIAYDAYQASLGGKPAPVLDGVSGDQRFFLGYAQVWRRNYREPNLRQRLLTDPHSPSEQRVYEVRNLDPWYAAYRVEPGQRLYLAPEQRVRIW
ncbi:MAG TPA: M13 family metallopeptidase [Bradyrhizobium sp.]|nr:M13 family metallopeptidase [Bradyrhizobium sp.]